MTVRALRRGSIAASRATGTPPNVLYLSLTGASSNYGSTPDSVAASITGDIDIRVKAAATDWTPTGQQGFITKFGSSSLSWRFYIASSVSGRLSLSVSLTGSDTVSAQSSAVTGFTDGTAHWVRVTRVAATGVHKFYTSENGVDWTQLGTDITASSGNIFDGTRPVEIGGYNAGLSQVFNGKIYYAEVRDGIDGTVVLSFDATTVTKTATRTPTTLPAGGTAGGTWTMSGTAWDWVT